jgi:outer membrane protein OmpA-like peptidoglycan-associated protein
MNRRLWCLLPVLLAGCTAKLTSTLPASAPAVSYIGAQTGVLSPGAALTAAVDGLRLDLEQTTRAAGAMPVEFSRDGDILKLRLGADASFGPDSAQLQAGALRFYAALAQVLARRPGTVAHILVHGEVASAELPTDLTARRAASLEAYLAARGVPETRLRAEGRGSAQRLTPDASAANRRIEFVLKPIVAGQEAAAWAPPS